MSKETAKKNWRRNIARMYTFTVITVAINVVYTLVILYHNGGLPGFRDLLAMAFWAGQEYVALSMLKAAATPRLGAQGELLSCIDASNPKELGLNSFAQDALWVCWVVQLLCCIHAAFFVFYLPLPATVMYKLWHSALRPLAMAYLGLGVGAAGAEGDSAEGGGRAGNAVGRSRQERRREELRQRKTRRGASS